MPDPLNPVMMTMSGEVELADGLVVFLRGIDGVFDPVFVLYALACRRDAEQTRCDLPLNFQHHDDKLKRIEHRSDKLERIELRGVTVLLIRSFRLYVCKERQDVPYRHLERLKTDLIHLTDEVQPLPRSLV